jgi:hypothetical protein
MRYITAVAQLRTAHTCITLISWFLNHARYYVDHDIRVVIKKSQLMCLLPIHRVIERFSPETFSLATPVLGQARCPRAACHLA